MQGVCMKVVPLALTRGRSGQLPGLATTGVGAFQGPLTESVHVCCPVVWGRGIREVGSPPWRRLEIGGYFSD